MSEMDILSQMIKGTALVQLEEEYGKPIVKLSEPQAPDSSATIRNLPTDAMVIKVDAFRSPDDVFNGGNGECKRADYVIISEEKKCIIYIEMKRTKDGWNQIVKQLLGSQCFVKYCQEVGKGFWNEKNFLIGYKSRFISIGHTSIAKKKTRITRDAEPHDAPDRAMKIDWPNYLQFGQLAGLGA
ncbi:hypothetical protein [Halothiobacillus sp.]|uniref:hypothetical protein n=1 Tax=Halothiobacillus sp. TaxID=1891311 RepID=UPI002619B1C0|nr:hypothetical protein [Halothiobacillus sp.]MDD4966081.1 hypothetical protein [Halothiobacillus sp.]